MAPHRISVGIIFLGIVVTTLLKDDFPRVVFIIIAAVICIGVVLLFEWGTGKGSGTNRREEND